MRGFAQGAPSKDVHALATAVDAHYNHLRSLHASFTEHYAGMGQQRTEHGDLLLGKPGRMRWTYSNGKVFLLDGKSAISYVPGDIEAQRVPAKQLDDLRSPPRFLLGHTQLEKELNGLHAEGTPDGTVILSGAPRFGSGADSARLQRVSLRILPQTGTITGLELQEIDGARTSFDLSAQEENIPLKADDFRFSAPAGVRVVDGLPPV